MFSSDRDQLRLQYFHAWQAHLSGKSLDPLQKQIVAVLIDHPEYQALFHDQRSMGAEYAPEQGQTNPFLHMGMHLAIREQVATNRPDGISEAHRKLLEQCRGDHHETEHRMIDCLGESLWKAQKNGSPPDESEYLSCLQNLSR